MHTEIAAVLAGEHCSRRRLDTVRRCRGDLRAEILGGVSNGVNLYGIPPTWTAALHTARTVGPHALIDTVHSAEATDPDGRRWPRCKPHDDKTVALIDFTPAGMTTPLLTRTTATLCAHTMLLLNVV